MSIWYREKHRRSTVEEELRCPPSPKVVTTDVLREVALHPVLSVETPLLTYTIFTCNGLTLSMFFFRPSPCPLTHEIALDR